MNKTTGCGPLTSPGQLRYINTIHDNLQRGKRQRSISCIEQGLVPVLLGR